MEEPRKTCGNGIARRLAAAGLWPRSALACRCGGRSSKPPPRSWLLSAFRGVCWDVDGSECSCKKEREGEEEEEGEGCCGLLLILMDG